MRSSWIGSTASSTKNKSIHKSKDGASLGLVLLGVSGRGAAESRLRGGFLRLFLAFVGRLFGRFDGIPAQVGSATVVEPVVVLGLAGADHDPIAIDRLRRRRLGRVKAAEPLIGPLNCG